jgi:hypothetical protein
VGEVLVERFASYVLSHSAMKTVARVAVKVYPVAGCEAGSRTGRPKAKGRSELVAPTIVERKPGVVVVPVVPWRTGST